LWFCGHLSRIFYAQIQAHHVHLSGR
jgi:hypothetical protein